LWELISHTALAQCGIHTILRSSLYLQQKKMQQTLPSFALSQFPPGFDMMQHARRILLAMELDATVILSSSRDLHLLHVLLPRFAATFPYSNVDYCLENLPAVCDGTSLLAPFSLCRSVDFISVFRNLVIVRRGGMCFELHCLFLFLLQALGFSAQLLPVYVNRNRKQPELDTLWNSLTTHVFSLVDFVDLNGNHSLFVCEIGIGSIETPLRFFDSGRSGGCVSEVQTAFDGLQYRLRERLPFCELEQWDNTNAKWFSRNRWLVSNTPARLHSPFVGDDKLSHPDSRAQFVFPDDLFPLLRRVYFPDSNIQTGFTVFLPSERGRLLKSLVGSVYAETRRAPGVLTHRIERTIVLEDVERILREEFGIEYSVECLRSVRMGPSHRFNSNARVNSDLKEDMLTLTPLTSEIESMSKLIVQQNILNYQPI
jgi:hypothetical protein